MKKLMTLIVLMCNCALGFASDKVEVGGLYYEIDGETATVVQNIWYYKGEQYYSPYDGDLYVIPPTITYDGLEYTVTGIGNGAFSESSAEVILPSTILKIGNEAFKDCKNIVKMVIPENVKSIGTNAFYDTAKFREVVFLSETAPSGWEYAAASKTYVPNVAKYYSASSSTASVLPIVSANKSLFVYTGQAPDMEFESGISYLETSFETVSSKIKDVGVHDIAVNTKITFGEYTYETSIPVQYEITPAEITVSTNNESREYGDVNPEFTTLYDGFVYGENADVLETKATATTSAIPSSDIGTYPIKIAGAKANNYTFNYVQGELTIEPAPLTARVKSESREYGCSNPTFTLNFEGLKNDETVPKWVEAPVFNTSATQTSEVGDYPVTATAIPKNYTLSEISAGVLSVVPAELKITAQDASRLYYEENPELKYRYSGFRNGESESILSSVPIVTTTAQLDSNVGQYEIAVSGSSAPNYEIEYQFGTLTLNTRTLSVQTGTYERAYGEDDPIFELQYDGFVANEGVDNISTLPIATTTATKQSNVGSYTINISGGEAANYSFSYKTGQLNIVKAEQEVIWNQNLTNLSVGQQVELLAYSTSELPVSYILDGDNVCEIYSAGNKKYLDCIGEGEVTIKATQDGNSNYYSTARVSKKVIVHQSGDDKPILTIKQLPIGSLSTSVDWGSIYTFTLVTESNWVVNSVTIDGVDYTNHLDKNGVFTTPSITQNSTIAISYTDINSGVDAVAAPKAKILGCEDGIVISCADASDTISIYTIDGYLVKFAKATSDDMFIPLSGNNTYIVKVGSETSKVRI